ncbi:hypothetical protein [Spirochaeta lutea]|uniref:Uncharacterized protein n=1 Tax=Spirochaeta lutea TaxID=1480694 RepID=A0A098R156_9SPIO|nr:hypothetical protein [Spirochaeta lutea]KGE72452.1 hypothetical protein DC28_07300 [Spirochaeta lutea]
MSKRMALVVVLAMLMVGTAAGQIVADRFASLADWTPGPGQWSARNGRLVQANESEALARIDRRVDQSRPYVVEFSVRYEGGGYADAQALRNERYHGGFGIQLGVENPALGRRAWGHGQSYLLWVNLDTRPETRQNYPEHYGLRLQVYESASNSRMFLERDARIRRDPVTSRYAVDDRLSMDYLRVLSDMGVTLRASDVASLFAQEATIRLSVDPRTGIVSATLPGLPSPVSFSLPNPELLRGTHISLRTNSIAASFDNFRVVRQ